MSFGRCFPPVCELDNVTFVRAVSVAGLWCERILLAEGKIKCVALPVAAAFHSECVADAQDPFLEALKEEKFSKAFHSTPDSVTLTDIGNGRIIEVNEGFERIMGYSRDEIVNTTALEIQLWVDPDDRVRLLNQLLDEGAVRHFETKLRRRDGNIRFCVMSAETIQLDTGPCMLAVSRDITEHKEAEMLLWEIAERLKLEREESSQKDAALKQILDHIDKEKTVYKQDLVSSVESLVTPVIEKLRSEGGHDQDIQRLERGLKAIIGKEAGA